MFRFLVKTHHLLQFVCEHSLISPFWKWWGGNGCSFMTPNFTDPKGLETVLGEAVDLQFQKIEPKRAFMSFCFRNISWKSWKILVQKNIYEGTN